MTDPASRAGAGPTGPPDTDVQAVLRAWWVPLVWGLLNLIAGLVVLIEPHSSLLAIALVLGIYLVIAGLLIAFAGWSRPTDRWILVGLGFLAIVAGIFVIARPGSAVHGVRIVFGIYLVIAGLLHLWAGAMEPRDRAYQLVRGLLELVAGLVFLFAPKLGLTALAVFVGIYLLLRAALEIGLALALRSAKRDVGL
ncbi:MAG: DUF308 domain-containing protein [Solirubrobacteraceae bacterium]